MQGDSGDTGRYIWATILHVILFCFYTGKEKKKHPLSREMSSTHVYPWCSALQHHNSLHLILGASYLHTTRLTKVVANACTTLLNLHIWSCKISNETVSAHLYNFHTTARTAGAIPTHGLTACCWSPIYALFAVLVAGGCCWSGVRGKHCWLAGDCWSRTGLLFTGVKIFWIPSLSTTKLIQCIKENKNLPVWFRTKLYRWYF